jgi:hypothetical protein
VPWWHQWVYMDFLTERGEKIRQAQEESGELAPDPPKDTGHLDPFAPALLMQQAGFTVEVAHPRNN